MFNNNLCKQYEFIKSGIVYDDYINKYLKYTTCVNNTTGKKCSCSYELSNFLYSVSERGEHE